MLKRFQIGQSAAKFLKSKKNVQRLSRYDETRKENVVSDVNW